MVITVYDFGHNGPVLKTYTYNDKVPVEIYDGDLVIDFADMRRI